MIQFIPKHLPTWNQPKWTTMLVGIVISMAVAHVRADEMSPTELELVRKVENQRIHAIEKVVGSVIAIYDEDRQGGGSGVIIDPSGIALTNHHVIIGAGVSGWGGLADGQLYHWKLIGTDPGGDVSIIQMEGLDEFPYTPLGDSDKVRVGDWALAMGNPFILTEDQAPTVTLGIVSGVKRYQPGAGANQLVYGNCIQVDSSINPGNSGGPLFNLQGQVIGINGRGSFQDRGRVNVGLGYAISSNQIKNFIPDLLATKLVEHATLDANFSDREGKVVCSTINKDAPVATAGLELGDELIEFEGEAIRNANQFTNLICTLPEDWPAHLVVRKSSGDVKSIHVRVFGLPYARPPKPKKKPGGGKPSPEEDRRIKRQQAMVELLAAPPGEVRFADINQKYASHVVETWQKQSGAETDAFDDPIMIEDEIEKAGSRIGSHQLWLARDGRFRVVWETMEDGKTEYVFDGKAFHRKRENEDVEEISLVDAKTTLPVIHAVALLGSNLRQSLKIFGTVEIDGGDKSQAQVAYRLRVVDADKDPLFVWIRLPDEAYNETMQLLKISARKNGDEGAIVFGDWHRNDLMQLPRSRAFVSDIDENITLKLVNRGCAKVDEVDWGDFASSIAGKSGNGSRAATNEGADE